MPLGLFLFVFFFWQPTAEQIRYAQLLSTEDPNDVKVKIKQVAFHFLFFLYVCSHALFVCVLLSSPMVTKHAWKFAHEMSLRRKY